MKLLVMAAVLVVALAAAVQVAANAPWARKESGPLQPGSHVTVTAPPLAGNQMLSWGMDLPWNPTATDIQLESVELIGTRGLSVIGVVVTYPVQTPDGVCRSIGAVYGFPPAGAATREVKGTVLPAAARRRCVNQPTVLVGVRLPADSIAGRIDALRVLYDYQGTAYELVLPYNLEVRRS